MGAELTVVGVFDSEKGVARNTYSLMKYITIFKEVVFMSRFKEFKQKLKDNKGKIIAGIIFVSGVAYVIVKQNGTIQELKLDVSKQSKKLTLINS